VNVRGTYLITRAFLQLIGADKPRATIVDVASSAAISVMPGGSAYCISKAAVAFLQQFIAAENPNVAAVSIHPGVVVTDMTTENAMFGRFAIDPPELPGGFAVWLTTEAARFLSGRYVDVHWPVDELVQRKDEIVQQGKLLMGLNTRLGADVA
jgi:NAD(P)-dependent dehydrogenase (short-subunit alcohol dehydrogenase family)